MNHVTKSVLLVNEYLVYAITDDNGLIDLEELEEICSDLNMSHITEYDALNMVEVMTIWNVRFDKNFSISVSYFRVDEDKSKAFITDISYNY